VTEIGGNAIRYNDIDTLGGNSGSGILHANSDSIVGVHTDRVPQPCG
jgi:V8-like Glu-specific endopeptidase